MSLKQHHKTTVNDAMVKEIVEALHGLRYGYVQIVVHDSRIVQIEKTEKTRFDDVRPTEKEG